LRGSFVPPAPIRELRDLTLYRKTIRQERSRVINRLHKVLEDADIKLASVATDVLGVSGRAMLDALVRGVRDPNTLADLARGALRRKLPALRQALQGRFSTSTRVPSGPSATVTIERGEIAFAAGPTEPAGPGDVQREDVRLRSVALRTPATFAGDCRSSIGLLPAPCSNTRSTGSRWLHAPDSSTSSSSTP